MGESVPGRAVIPLFPLGTPLFPGVVLPLQIFEPRYRRLIAELGALPEGPERRFGVVAIRQGWEVEQVAPAEALFDVGCTAVLRLISPRPDGGYRVVAVGGERFRLLDVLLPDPDSGEPPYLRAEVEWLVEEEAAEEAAGDSEAAGEGHPPALTGPGPGKDAADGPGDDVVTDVVRGSLELLAGNVRELFARYVADVAVRQSGGVGALPEDVLAALTGDEEDGEDGAEADPTASALREVSDDARGLSWLVASAALLTTEDRQALLAESATRRRLTLESRLLRRELTLLRTLGAVPVPLAQFAGPLTPN
ncbi:LON peptidase substrate-binding domain-containing protein [Modestobacter roseus]|uniref:LON peptidase substrate-binding domain-containing protein n=1 Tax=Modestobacter roseus TaxID=1181884 RepID=UPI0034DF1AF9